MSSKFIQISIIHSKDQRKHDLKLKSKCTGFNNSTGWIFFLKTINARYLISMHRVDFFPKTISAQCSVELLETVE